MVFTPFVVKMLIFLALLVLVILGTLVDSFLLRRRASRVNPEVINFDIEAQHLKGAAYSEVVDHGVKSASFWSPLSGRRPPSPSLELEL